MSSVKKLAYKLIVISLMVAGLVILPMAPAEREAKAFVTCEQCEINYENCANGCIDQPSGCASFCERAYNRCIATCE
jgi:CDP-diacylglycerol pyrophosphatase